LGDLFLTLIFTGVILDLLSKQCKTGLLFVLIAAYFKAIITLTAITKPAIILRWERQKEQVIEAMGGFRSGEAETGSSPHPEDRNAQQEALPWHTFGSG
jgi:hypothetical protein